MSGGRDTRGTIPPKERASVRDEPGAERTAAGASTAFIHSDSAVQALLERSPFGVFVSDAVHVLYANPRLSEITGYTHDELTRIKDPIDVLIVPEERGRLRALAGRRLRGEVPPEVYECRGLRRDGTAGWWELSMSRVLWQGQPALLGIVQDIGARKQIEVELRAAHAAWRALLDASTEAAALLDTEGHLLAWNEAIARSLGRQDADLQGADVYRFLPARVAARRRRWMQQVARERQPLRVADERGGRVFEHHLQPILDERGDVSRIAVYAHEITARRDAERAAQAAAEALAQRNRDLQALNQVIAALGQSLDLADGLRVALDAVLAQCELDAGAILVWGFGDKDGVTVVERGLPEGTGSWAQGPLGRALELVCREARESGRALWTAHLSEMGEEAGAALREGGFCRLCVAPVPMGGDLLGGIVLLGRDGLCIDEAQLHMLLAIAAQTGQAVESAQLRDLAAQVQVREGLLAGQSRFIADVSHEFRSPLGLVRSACQSLRSEQVAFEPQVRDRMLDIVDQESAYLETLVENLLDLAQQGRGAMALHCEQTDLVSLAQSVTARAEFRDGGRPIAVEADGDALWADVDPRAVTRVFTNLLSNAIKYSSPGSAVTVRMRVVGEDAVVSVTDQGIGIAPEHIGHVFERFFRAPGAAAMRARGVGLGLPVCKAMVEAHGGQIWVESTPGEGSRFTFRLPRGMSEGGEG